ncbi:MAG: DUF7380 domain-containing protein, partial [Candidatus Pararuminococcus gallinarum]
MKLSQYVLDAISTIEDLDYDNKHKVTVILKEASQNAQKEDARILSVLSGALSMSYSESEKNYQPMYVLRDGHRTFSMDDFQASDVEMLGVVANTVNSVWVRAQLLDILWILSKDYQYGKKSILIYLKWFQDAFDPNEWVECHRIIHRALDISKQLGKSSQEYKQVRETINDAIFKLNGTDPLFLSINLIQLVFPDAQHKDIEKYLQVVNKILQQRIDEQNENFHLVEETFSVQRSLLKRLKCDEKIVNSNLNLGNYYEKQANKLLERNDKFKAIILLKKACFIYAKVKSERLLEVRARLTKLQQSAVDNMTAIPLEFNVQQIYETVSKLFWGLSLQEVIIQLGRLVRFCKVEEVEKEVIKEQKQFIFKSLFPSAILNEHGKITETLPPLDIENPKGNPDLFRKHMVQFVSQRRRIGEAVALRFAYKFLQDAGTLSEEEFDFLVFDNPIVPDGREEIVRTGLYLGLSGKLY